MVTEAGKELLRNSINTANFHNKIIEQNEMWKQWEIERGLTMMVSDDDVLKKIRKNHRCSKHRKMGESSEWSRSSFNIDAAGTSSADRWDHSGFNELYPNESTDKRPSLSSSGVKDHSKKWGHSGFHRLYPEDAGRERSSSTSSSSKGVSKKCDRDVSSDESEERQLVSSRKCKKKCRRCQERFFNAVKERSLILSRSKKKREEEICPEDIQERLLLLSKGKNYKGKCRRCRERFANAAIERDLILSSPEQYEKKSNSYSYRKLYDNEFNRRPSLSHSPRKYVERSLSPPPRRHANRPLSHPSRYLERSLSPPPRRHANRPLSHPPRNYVNRSLSPPPKERIVKWDHDGFLELYPELRVKKKSSRLRKSKAQREKEEEKKASF